MNGIFIIPTGLGCSIGGHAGDAVCAVNLIASQCDKLIVNPNAVNASDINEMAGNCLYVEGSIIDEFVQCRVRLQEVRRNNILLMVNGPVSAHTINSVNAARVALGVDIEIVELATPLTLCAFFKDDGSAGGSVRGVNELLRQAEGHDFDALAVQSPIDVDDDVVRKYLKHGGVNPWGGIEACASRMIAREARTPVAHAPHQREDDYFKDFNDITDPRMAAEMVSVSYLHCVLKGLSKAPRPVYHLERNATLGSSLLAASGFDFLITPDGCFGVVHETALEQGIEVIVVEGNKTVLERRFPPGCTFVKNYLEAAGVIACRSIGIKEQYVMSGSLAHDCHHAKVVRE